MAGYLDTSKFTTPQQFQEAYEGVRVQKAPLTPEERVTRENHPSEAAYLEALDAARKAYSQDVIEFAAACAVAGRVVDDFEIFAVKRLGLDHLPEKDQEELINLARKRAGDGTLISLYEALERYVRA